jgi:phage-related protein
MLFNNQLILNILGFPKNSIIFFHISIIMKNPFSSVNHLLGKVGHEAQHVVGDIGHEAKSIAHTVGKGIDSAAHVGEKAIRTVYKDTKNLAKGSLETVQDAEKAAAGFVKSPLFPIALIVGGVAVIMLVKK